jgi:pyruvate, orthophosphate dikinase
VTSVYPLAADVTAPADVIGGKAYGLVVLRRLGLPVPDGFVISTRACREFLHHGRLPDEELAASVARLRAAGVAEVSVRSGASVSMPGMMTTVLGVRLDGDGLRDAIGAVFASWHTPRAVTYRELHGIAHDRGTAVTVQAMVYGDRDERSGSGVAFSRDPTTGEPTPFGEVLFGRRGDAVVSGAELTRPLSDLAAREPAVWSSLLAALHRLEAHYRDACYVEFTYESGALWLLQVRPGGFAGLAGVRVATDLVDEGVITRAEAVARVDPRPLAHLRPSAPWSPRLMRPPVSARQPR